LPRRPQWTTNSNKTDNTLKKDNFWLATAVDFEN
jgi:hypothetical protein